MNIQLYGRHQCLHIGKMLFRSQKFIKFRGYAFSVKIALIVKNKGFAIGGYGFFNGRTNAYVGNAVINGSVNEDADGVNAEFRNGPSFGEALICRGEAECSAEHFSVNDFSAKRIRAPHHGERALGIADACVIGVSLGGMIAQEIAVCAPDLVKKLVLGVTASRTNDTMRAVVGHWIDLAESGDFGGIVRDMLSVMYSEDYVRRYGWLFSLLAPFAKPKNEVRFLCLAKACLSCDVYDRLDRITSPTLVLGGADDQIVTGAASLEIAERCGCTVHLYDGLGHAAYEEAADFNARIYDFLQKSAEING